MSTGNNPGEVTLKRPAIPVFVASTVMLTFISWYRAAAIVLNDMGSSAFYAGSIAEQAFGKAAPWFVLGVMLFSFTVRSVYVESCSMFVRGGVYKVVKEALGGRLAKMAVSALMFDYILTGPISGVSAGQYIAGLINEILVAADAHGWIPGAAILLFHGTPQLPINGTSVVVAIAITIYFWRQNIKGIEESSDKAMKVMQVTTIMVVLLLGWSFLTLLMGNYSLPPFPLSRNLHFGEDALGFLKYRPDLPHLFGLFGIMMAFGHSILAMSGEETLAQVYREIAHPKLKNLKKTALVIAIYSFAFTGVSSLLVVMIVPDSVRMQPDIKDNLLGALAMYLTGPQFLKLIFRAFVVFVGFLMLAGAINTAIVGSNGVLNRVSEDGVLTDWFRKPHKRYGTTSRIMNLVVLCQLAIILLSRGDVYVLGEAYAFGVLWSFVFNSTSMLVLRFKYKGERGWKVPLNLRIRGVEIPLGLGSVTLVLITLAVVNLFTKSVATVSGLISTAIFFTVFTVSERINRRKIAHADQMKEHFRLVHEETVERERIGIRPGNIVVTVRDYNSLNQLRWVLERTDTKQQDVVVVSVRLSRIAGAGGFDLSAQQMFSDYEQTLFTRAVAIAEKFGKHVSLLVVPARDVWSAIVQTANDLESSAVVAQLSTRMSAEEQAFRLGRAWESAPEPKRQFVFHVVLPDMRAQTFRIGPHTPSMKPEDVQLVHHLWLQITQQPGMEKVHHSDIITEALSRFAKELTGEEKTQILNDLRQFGARPVNEPPPRYSQPAPSAPSANPGAAGSPPPDGRTDRSDRELNIQK